MSKWETLSGGIPLIGTSTTRTAAMNRVDRIWRPGSAMVRNPSTGETWERRRGTWIKIAEACRPKMAAAS